jgi:hypothetical protein
MYDGRKMSSPKLTFFLFIYLKKEKVKGLSVDAYMNKKWLPENGDVYKLCGKVAGSLAHSVASFKQVVSVHQVNYHMNECALPALKL